MELSSSKPDECVKARCFLSVDLFITLIYEPYQVFGVIIMLFGSDEMYFALKQLNIYDAISCNNLYNELYESIKSYTLSKLKKGFRDHEVKLKGVPVKGIDTSSIPVYDYDEIVDEVFCCVFKQLGDFLHNCEEKHYCEAQRQAWLKMNVYIAFANYFNELLSIPEPIDTETQTPIELSTSWELHELLRAVIHSVCHYNTNMVEKKMAYIFNVIIFKAYDRRIDNASAKTTAQFMNGKSMFVLKNRMKSFIYEIFLLELNNKDIESIVIEVGDKTPTITGKRICNITTKIITDWTNRIKMHIISDLYKEGLAYNG